MESSLCVELTFQAVWSMTLQWGCELFERVQSQVFAKFWSFIHFSNVSNDTGLHFTLEERTQVAAWLEADRKVEKMRRSQVAKRSFKSQ